MLMAKNQNTKYACLNDFRKNKEYEIKLFPRKCNSIIKNCKLSRSKN